MSGITTPGFGTRWPNAILLLIIGAAMLGLIFLVYQTVEAERMQRERAQLTSDILQELQRVDTATVNGETGQRGYLITLDDRYLEPFRQGREQIDPALRRLNELLSDNATLRQLELLDQIDVLARAKFSEMEDSVVLVQDGRLLDARRAILTDEGQETMERLRRSLDEMEEIERRLLARQAEEVARLEGRLLPLLGLLILLLLLAIFFGSRLVSRAARHEAEAAQASAIGEARDRADLLARELNHRVKNLFAVVLAIVQMSARDRPEAQPVTEAIAQRVRALLTAHEVSQGELEREVASLETLIETTLAPYRSHKHQAKVTGPEVLLPAKRISPLGLVFHELTTNAVKYGAWSSDGRIDVRWDWQGDDIVLTWQESGVPIADPPERKGFGSLLMESAARQFGGTVSREFKHDGLIVTIDLPQVRDPASLASAKPAP